jgi:hypothetical protein
MIHFRIHDLIISIQEPNSCSQLWLEEAGLYRITITLIVDDSGPGAPVRPSHVIMPLGWI